MSNVRNLFALNAERRQELEQFYANQATFFMQQIANPAGGAAALSIAVTGESQVVTKLAGVDAVHAAILLNELDTMRAQLVQFITEQEPELLEKVNQAEHGHSQAANVVPLRKSAVRDAQVIALRS
jgi:hypothetical protein